MSVVSRLARLQSGLGMSGDPLRRVNREELQERLLELNQAIVTDPSFPLALRSEVAIQTAGVDPNPQRSRRILTGIREVLVGRPRKA